MTVREFMAGEEECSALRLQCRVPDIFQEAPDLLQIVSGVVLQPSAVTSGLAAVMRNVTKKTTNVRYSRPLGELQGSAAPGAPAGVLVESLNTLHPTPPSRQQWSCGLQELHHRSPGPVRNGPGNTDVNTLALLQREILVVTLKF